jgi:hypothetical protein
MLSWAGADNFGELANKLEDKFNFCDRLGGRLGEEFNLCELLTETLSSSTYVWLLDSVALGLSASSAITEALSSATESSTFDTIIAPLKVMGEELPSTLTFKTEI